MCSFATGEKQCPSKFFHVLCSLLFAFCTTDNQLYSTVELYCLFERPLSLVWNILFTFYTKQVPGCSSLVRGLILHGNETPVRVTDSSKPNELDNL